MRPALRILALLSLAASAPAAAADTFTLTSEAFAEGDRLPEEQVLDGFGCAGGNVSPPLDWAGAPEGTRSFVVTAYDPDAPTGSGWWHWVVFDIPANVGRLAEGAGSGGELPEGAVEGRTDFGAPGFGGACPPPGAVHRYVFTVHALDVPTLGLGAEASAALVGFMTRAHALGSARLTAVYAR